MSLVSPSRVVRWVTSWDIRFTCPADEEEFRKRVDEKVVVPTALTSLFTLPALAYLTLSNYIREARREDAPFVGASEDPRTLYFSAGMLSTIVILLVCAASTLRLMGGRLAAWRWELVPAAAGAFANLFLPFASRWHVALLYGKAPECVWLSDTAGADLMEVIMKIAFVTLCCLYIPMRACVLWILPASATLSTAFIVWFAGASASSSYAQAVGSMLFVFFGSLQGARRNEQRARETWLAEKKAAFTEDELKENAGVLSAFQTVASTMCELVVLLDQGLCVTQPDQRVNAFFGKTVDGDHFPSNIADDDRQRFHDALRVAAETPGMQSVPVGLNLHFATLKVQLIVVATQHIQSAQYLVGIHSVEHMSNPGEQREVQRLELASSRDSGSEGDASSYFSHRQSLASTTGTGKVFADVSRLPSTATMSAHLQRQLGDIANLGESEHWLVSAHDVELLPQVKFGSGGFGVVVGARLRGHPVVAKLPRQAAQLDSVQFMCTLANELRIHRQLRHPNIAAFAGAVIDPHHYDIALLFEVVEGVHLDVFLSRSWKTPGAEGRSPKDLKLLLDIGCAMCYLHGFAPPVVHADLKPANVLVQVRQEMPDAKLLDFGLSSLLTKNSALAGGTRGWMAPEMQDKLEKPSPRADVFAFGLLMRFIISGERPKGASKPETPDGTPTEPHSIQASEILEECRQMWTACTFCDPTSRPEMASVYDALLNLLPCGRGALQPFGSRMWMSALEGVSWHIGRKELGDKLRTGRTVPPQLGSASGCREGSPRRVAL